MPTNLKWKLDFCSAVLTNQLHSGSVLGTWLSISGSNSYWSPTYFKSANNYSLLLFSSLCCDSRLFIQWGVATPRLTFSGIRDFTLHLQWEIATPCFTYSGERRLHASHTVGSRNSMLHLQLRVVTSRFTYSGIRNSMLHLQQGVVTSRFTYSGKSRLITAIQSRQSMFKNIWSQSF